MTILSLVIYVFIQVATVIIGLIIIQDNRMSIPAIIKSWVFGHMLTYAVLHILAVPMILFRLKFDVLFWSFLVSCLMMLCIGCHSGKKRIWKNNRYQKQLSWLTVVLMITVIVLIVYQASIYFFGIHLDEDDSRWLAEANDALVYGDMMTRNPTTGEYYNGFINAKDVVSPWPMMFAIVSRLLLNTRVSIVAHTLYPTITLLMMYGVYWLIAIEIFQKREAQLSFLLFVGVINLFFAGTVYTQSVFSMVRIWQGKATVAGVIIPLILYVFVCINRRNETNDWVKSCIIGTGAGLLSGMGLSLPAVMIGVLGLYDILVYRRWRRLFFLALSLMPIIVFSLLYFYLKG